MQLPAPFGKYELLETIGSGGMADVFLARSFGAAGFEKRLVIKRIKPEHARDPRFVSLFIHEAKIGVHLNHPNIVQVHELGKVGDQWFIAMEHLHGRDLNRVVKSLRAQERTLPPDVAVRIVAEVCRGLAFAHGDPRDRSVAVVHRDVSPHNVFVTFNGDVKLVDFGIARMLGSDAEAPSPDEQTVANRPGGGKYAYMSPEQARGWSVDHRTDLFSAGIVLWELLVGERLYQGADPADKLRRVREAVIPSPASRGVEIDPALQSVLDRALARDPDDRYPSAADFEEDLRSWLYDQPARPGRGTLGQLLRELFPEDAERDPAGVELRRLADDLERLGIDDTGRTHTDEGGTAGTPTPSEGSTGGLQAAEEERKHVAVLVVDIDGFTDLSIRAEPEVLFKRHLQLLRFLREVIGEHGGTIQHVHDDQAYVFFGMERTRRDDLRRALSCAAELHRRVGHLHDVGVPVQLAIGVHAGDITLGKAGSRLRYMARGDTTRLARRLSEQADHGQVLASDAVFRLASDTHAFRRGPWLVGRGGKPNQLTYALDGVRTEPGARSLGAWVRRGQELETIRSALGELAEGRGVTVVVHGEAGTGKSRLLAELADAARRRRIAFHAGHASAFASPTAAPRGVLLSILGLSPTTPDVEVAEAAARFRELGLHGRDLDALEHLLGVGRHRLDAGDLWAAVRRVLAALAEDGPLVVAFEDVHHLPRRDADHLAAVSARLASSPVLLLLTMQGLPPRALAHATSVHLDALDGEGQIRLVAGMLQAKTVAPELIALVARTCEGNPLYVQETVRFLLDRELVAVDDGEAALVGEASPDLPGTLTGVVTARIDALDPGAKGALQVAAVMGSSFDLPLLAETIGIDDPVPLVAELAAHHLIRRTETRGRWAFASEFVRQATLRGVLGVQRRDLHRLVAETIARRTEDDPGASALLADHWAGAGRMVDAARHAYLAGRRAEDAGHPDEALTWYRKGASWIAKAEPSPATYDARVQGEAMLRLRIGALCRRAGDVPAARTSLQIALEIAADGGMPWLEVQAHTQLAEVALDADQLGQADAHLGQAKALARLEGDTATERELLALTADLARRRGDREAACEAWRARLAGDETDQDRASSLLGFAATLAELGDLDEAVLRADEALHLARGDGSLEAKAAEALGHLAWRRGDADGATRWFRRALQLWEDDGDRRRASLDQRLLGEVHLLRGDLTRATVAYTRSRELAEEADWSDGLRHTELWLAFLAARRGEDGAVDRLGALRDAAATARDEATLGLASWLVAALADPEAEAPTGVGAIGSDWRA